MEELLERRQGDCRPEEPPPAERKRRSELLCLAPAPLPVKPALLSKKPAVSRPRLMARFASGRARNWWRDDWAPRLLAEQRSRFLFANLTQPATVLWISLPRPESRAGCSQEVVAAPSRADW